MLFHTQFSQCTQIAIIPAKVYVGIAEPTHERPAFAVNRTNTSRLGKLFSIWHFANIFDALACID
jgi:hypothetical protein